MPAREPNDTADCSRNQIDSGGDNVADYPSVIP
jgi:hypothetical protein